MTMNPEASFAVSDEQLCEGDRDAFSTIVERYQSLVCSLAYAACGLSALSRTLFFPKTVELLPGHREAVCGLAATGSSAWAARHVDCLIRSRKIIRCLEDVPRN